MGNNDTTLEVVDDDGAAWRECGPDGCTTSRSRMPRGEDYNDTRAALEALVADANGAAGDALQALAEAGMRAETALAGLAAAASFVATALHWALPIQWGRRVKQVAQDQPQEGRSDV